LNDPIQRAELRTLLDDVAPAIANLSEIVATQDAANVDALTGLLNRAGIEARLRSLFAAPHELQATALMLDVDHFKEINDSLGHAQGDAVLREIAAVIEENCRSHDVVGRYGGEEFLVLLQSVDSNEALEIAERIRCAISDRLHVTVSIGLTEYSHAEDAQAVIARADSALYSAKRAGRNRCISV
jgi:diguanylate cyclase (GGDEF)-like protein